MAKVNLPALYGDEAREFRELFEKGNNRTTGITSSFTSATSSIQYNYTNGEEELFQLLATTLVNSNIIDSEYNQIVDDIDDLMNDSVYTNVDQEQLLYTDGLLTTVISNISATLYKVETLSYTDGILTNVNTKIYENDGVTLTYEFNEILNYTDGVLTSVDKVVV